MVIEPEYVAPLNQNHVFGEYLQPVCLAVDNLDIFSLLFSGLAVAFFRPKFRTHPFSSASYLHVQPI